MPEQETLYGMLAEFDTPEALVEAFKVARAEGYRDLDAFRAECPGGDPGLWRDMVLGVHYVIAPVIVVLLAVVVVRIYGDGDSDGPAIATSRLPKARANASRRS